MRDFVGRSHLGSRDASGSADGNHSWRRRPDVLSCKSVGLLFLLSLRTGRYHTLEEPGGTIWDLLETGRRAEEIAAAWSRRFPLVQRETIDADVWRLLADLSQRQLIEPVAQQDTNQGARRAALRRTVLARRLLLPSTLRCLGRLAIVHVLLSTLGLRAALRIIGRRATCDPAPVSLDFVDLLAHRVASAGVYYPFGAACLEHSVCLFWAARRCGIDLDLRIGVQPFPFSAHAWVEYRGRVVNDTPEQIALFTPFEPIPLAEF